MISSRRAGVTMDGQSYRLYRPPKGAAPGNESWDSAVVNFPIQIKDVETIQNTWHGGFGYSRAGSTVPPGGYAWAQVGYCWDPYLFLPPGKIEELTMPADTKAASTTAISRQPIAGRDWQNSDGTTDFLFTCGEYICMDKGGAGTITTEFFGGNGANHGVQYISAELFDDANGSAIYFGLFWNNAIGHPYDSVVKYNASGFSRAGANYVSWGRAKVAHMAPNGALSGLVPTGYSAGAGTDYLICADTSQIAGTNNRLIAIPKGSDPLDITKYATWMKIGLDKHAIAGIVGSRQHAFVIKPDGAFDFDEVGNAPQLVNWWNDVIDRNNGLCSLYYDGGIIVSHAMGLDWINVSDQTPRQDVPEWITPGFNTSNETPIRGRVVALAQANGKVYAAINSGGQGTYIVTGAPRRSTLASGGLGRFVWHGAEAYFPDAAISMMYVSNASGRPMMYYGGVDIADGVTPRMFRQYLPSSGSPLSDLLYGASGFKFHPTASIYFPIDSWNYPGANKLVQAFDIQADGLTADTYVEMLAAADLANPYDTASYISQGVLAEPSGGTLFSDDGTGTDDVPGGYLWGRHIATRIDLHGTETAPARLRSLMKTAAIKVRTSAERPLKFEITNQMPANECSLDNEDLVYAYQHLVSLQDDREFTMLDEVTGEPNTVLMTSGSVSKGYEPHESGVGYVGVVSCRVRLLNTVAHYDMSDNFDSGERFS